MHYCLFVVLDKTCLIALTSNLKPISLCVCAVKYVGVWKGLLYYNLPHGGSNATKTII